VLRGDDRFSKLGELGVSAVKKEFGYLTTEARSTRSKEFLIKKFADLCELCASAVKIE
jgi:hypothetical protein